MMVYTKSERIDMSEHSINIRMLTIDLIYLASVDDIAVAMPCGVGQMQRAARL